jgi:hypothetical protein
MEALMKYFIYCLAALALGLTLFSIGCSTTSPSSIETTVVDISDSRWTLSFHNPKFGKKEFDLVFYADGKLGYLSPANTTPDNDFWEQIGNKVILKVNYGFAIYEGELINPNTLAGTATSKTGGTWEWKASRKR